MRNPTTPTAAQIDDATAIFMAEQATRAVAFWTDGDGNTYQQGQATVDNRPARVMARIRRYTPDAAGLVVVTRKGAGL